MTNFDGILSLIGDNIVLLVFVHAAIHARSEIMKIWHGAIMHVEICYGRVALWTRALFGIIACFGLIVAIAPVVYYGQIAFGHVIGRSAGH